MLGVVIHLIGNRPLRWRVGRKCHELMNFSKFDGQHWCGYAVTHLPASGMIGYTKRRNDKLSVTKTRVRCDGVVLLAIKHHMFINFVRDNDKIIVRRQFG